VIAVLKKQLTDATGRVRGRSKASGRAPIAAYRKG
jgi:hypothetical protein